MQPVSFNWRILKCVCLIGSFVRARWFQLSLISMLIERERVTVVTVNSAIVSLGPRVHRSCVVTSYTGNSTSRIRYDCTNTFPDLLYDSTNLTISKKRKRKRKKNVGKGTIPIKQITASNYAQLTTATVGDGFEELVVGMTELPMSGALTHKTRTRNK